MAAYGSFNEAFEITTAREKYAIAWEQADGTFLDQDSPTPNSAYRRIKDGMFDQAIASFRPLIAQRRHAAHITPHHTTHNTNESVQPQITTPHTTPP